jgi:2'-5' RNA ligase
MTPESLHVTVCTLGLDTPEAIDFAKAALERLKPEIADTLPKKPLRLEGVDKFFNRVVYAKVHADPEIMDFANYVKLLVREAGLEIRDQHDFVPHMTIMKTTPQLACQRKIKRVDVSLYSPFTDMVFGSQPVTNLHICRMGKERRPDGFYVTPAEIHFD